MLADMAEGSGDHYREDYDSHEDDEYAENGSGSGDGKMLSTQGIHSSITQYFVSFTGQGEVRVEVDSSNITPTTDKPSNSNRISTSSILLTYSVVLLAVLFGSSSH